MFNQTIFVLAVLPLLLCSTIHGINLQPINIDSSELKKYTDQQLVAEILKPQNELNEKLIKHYITYLSQKWTDLKINDFSYRHKLFHEFDDQNREKTGQQIWKFMRKRLMKHLDMEQLSDSFMREIQQNPEQYFLTSEMYDLLIDNYERQQTQ